MHIQPGQGAMTSCRVVVSFSSKSRLRPSGRTARSFTRLDAWALHLCSWWFMLTAKIPSIYTYIHYVPIYTTLCQTSALASQKSKQLVCQSGHLTSGPYRFPCLPQVTSANREKTYKNKTITKGIFKWTIISCCVNLEGFGFSCLEGGG